MYKHEFKIGEHFYTASGEWICTDIGSRTIIAYNIDDVNPHDEWDMQNNIVFYEYEFMACSLHPYDEN